MITITILSTCFLLAVSLKIKHYQDRQLAVLCWYLHLLFAALSAVCLILYWNGYVFKGIHTDRVFYSLYAGSGMVLYGLSTEKGTGRKAYLSLFYALPFIIIGGLLLPPLRIYVVVASIWLLVDGSYKRYKVDDDYAVQTRSTAVINSRYPVYSLVEGKYWILEKITDDVVNPRQNAYDIQARRVSADSIQLHIFTDHLPLDTTIAVQ